MSEPPVNFPCPTCERTFPTKLHLKNHRRIHSTADYLCPLPGCTYSSKRKDTLGRHLACHEKKNPGSTVGYELSRPSVAVAAEKRQRIFGPSGASEAPSAQVPEQKSDPVENAAAAAAVVTDEPAMVAANVQLFPCIFCDYKGKRQWLLNRHYTKVHPESTENLMKLNLSDFNCPGMLPYPEACRYYQLSVHRDYEHKVGGVRFLDTRLKFRGLERVVSIVHILDYLHKIVSNLVAAHVTRLPETDKIRFVLQASSYLWAPISTPFVLVGGMSTNLIMDAIAHVLQSAENFRLDDGVDVDFVHLPLPVPASGAGGNGRLGTIKRPKVPLPQYIKERRSAIPIQNNDQLCVARSLCVAKKHADGAVLGTYIRQGNREQTSDANELHQICEVPEGACSLEEIQKFAEHPYFASYSISVFTVVPAFVRIYSSASAESDKKIFLLMHGGHCDVLTSVTGFSGFKYYCHLCGEIYGHQPHACTASCQMCKHPKCPNRETTAPWSDRNCQSCRRIFRTDACQENHNKEEVCKNERWCEKCQRRFPRKKFDPETGEHPNCGLRFCPVCQKHVTPDNHPFCYLQPYEQKEKKQKHKKKKKKKKSNGDETETETETEEGSEAAAAAEAVIGLREPEDIEDVCAIDLLGGDLDEEDLERAEQAELAAEEEGEDIDGKQVHCYYFDIESDVTGTDGVHRPNLLCVEKDSGEEKTFSGDDPAAAFMEWILSQKCPYWRIFIAHNLKG